MVALGVGFEIWSIDLGQSLTGWYLILKGEGCVALRAAQGCYTEFFITLTHHGEKTGTFTGGIQLHTSEGKPTEKLYGESGNQLVRRLSSPASCCISCRV